MSQNIATTHHRMFIDGEFADTSTGKTIPVINPSNEEFIAEVPACSAADADAAVLAAERAQKSWAKLPAIERAAYLHEIAHVVRAHADEQGEFGLHALRPRAGYPHASAGSHTAIPVLP